MRDRRSKKVHIGLVINFWFLYIYPSFRDAQFLPSAAMEMGVGRALWTDASSKISAEKAWEMECGGAAARYKVARWRRDVSGGRSKAAAATRRVCAAAAAAAAAWLTTPRARFFAYAAAGHCTHAADAKSHFDPFHSKINTISNTPSKYFPLICNCDGRIFEINICNV
jgi:hypothetical protein